MDKSGIYSITNSQSGRVYYGSSNNIEKRWNNHKSKLRKRIHPNPHLQNAWNKYGEQIFKFKIEEDVSSKKLQEVEQWYLNWCKLFSFWSYNIGYDAECSVRGMKFGPPSEEHRRKIGIANGGINSANYGKKLSDETRRKMSDSKRGKPKPPRTEEHKKRLGLNHKGDKNNRYDGNVYTFYHPELGVEKCDRHTLVAKYNLNKSCIGHVIQGIRNSYKEWRII